MALADFPAIKLVTAAMRQVSKYLVDFMKKEARQSAFFRNHICIPSAQMYHFVEVKSKMWVLKLGRPVEVRPLNQADAIELGATLLGEFVLYAVCATALIMEITRQKINEKKLRRKAIAEILALQQGFIDLNYEMEIQDAQLMELRRALSKLGVYMREKPYAKPKIYKKDEHVQTFTKMMGKKTQTMKIK